MRIAVPLNVIYNNKLQTLGLYSLQYPRVFCDLILCYNIIRSNGFTYTEIASVLIILKHVVK